MIEQLVADLPEVYQPIYSHPEISTQVSRISTDRLEHIIRIHDSLQGLLDRPLKVLDLGCAQGFFSLKLAEHGACVHGIDYLDKNIAVCDALAQEHPQLHVSFETRRVEDVIESLQPGCYDLVLGLSVLHHIIHDKGIVMVKKLLERAASLSGALVVELALREEPLYWAPSQPEDPCTLLDAIAFYHEFAHHTTHLAPIPRPLFVASDHYWILGDQICRFESWSVEPHILANGTHERSRRYFFGTDSILKMYRFDLPRGEKNKTEFKREIQFLQSSPTDFPIPALLAYGENRTGAWVVSQRIPGRLLIDLLREDVMIDHKAVILAVLAQLVSLEKAGLYHDDVRTWNVLVAEDGNIRLIDYGSISTGKLDCFWPGNLFLSFFIFVKEVATGVVTLSDDLRTISISPYGLPKPYCVWATTLWSRPLAEWSFELMYHNLLETLTNEQGDPVLLPVEAWMKATEEAIHVLNLSTIYVRHKTDAQIAIVNKANERAGQAEAQATQANERADQAEAQATQANERTDQAEAQATQANERADQAEAQATQANERADQAEAQATQANARASQAEAQAIQANELAGQAEVQATQANERAGQAEAQATQADERAGQAEAQATQADERAGQAEAQATQADERAGQAEAQATQADERAGQAEAQATQADERAGQAEAQATQANERAGQAEAQATQANERAGQAEAQATQANERAGQAETAAYNAWMQYQAVINSRSWKITAPLRWVVDMVKWFVCGSVAWLTLRPGSIPRRAMRLVLLHLRNWVMLRPRVKAKVLSIINSFPKLKVLLLSVHQSEPFMPPQISPEFAASFLKDEEAQVPADSRFSPNSRDVAISDVLPVEIKNWWRERCQNVSGLSSCGRNESTFKSLHHNSDRVLQLTTYDIKTPDNGGKLRCNHIRRALSQEFDVQTLSFDWGDRLDCSTFSVTLDSKFLSAIGFDGNLGDIAICEFLDVSMDSYRSISSRVQVYSPKIILLEQLYLWPLVKRFIEDGTLSPFTKIIYSSQNIEVELKKNVYASLYSPHDAVRHLTKVHIMEQDAILGCSAAIAVSKKDMAYIQAVDPQKPTRVFHNGSSIPNQLGSSKKWLRRFNKYSKNWVFIGSYHLPNIDGLKLLVEALQCLEDYNEDIALWILGGVGNGLVEAITDYQSEDFPFLHILGNVSAADIDSAIMCSSGIVLPIWHGGGTNLKTAQALLSEKYVIGTACSFRGFEKVKNEAGISIVDSAEDMARLMIEIQPYENYSRGKNVSKLQWESILKNLPVFINEVSTNKVAVK